MHNTVEHNKSGNFTFAEIKYVHLANIVDVLESDFAFSNFLLKQIFY
jgi:hypothetical protein